MLPENRVVIHDIEDIQYRSEPMVINTTPEDFDTLFQTPEAWDLPAPVKWPLLAANEITVTDTPIGELPMEVKIVQITGKGKRAAGLIRCTRKSRSSLSSFHRKRMCI